MVPRIPRCPLSTCIPGIAFPHGQPAGVFGPLFPGRELAAIWELRSAGIELPGESRPAWQHFHGPDGNMYEQAASCRMTTPGRRQMRAARGTVPPAQCPQV